MSEKSGFYPSNVELGIINEYTGYELGKVYKRIISNGIFANNLGKPSDDLQVVASSGLTVVVKKGEGIFLDQWYENTENLSFTLDSETSLNRIDYIVIEANKNPNVLKTYARVIKGTPASVPVAPSLISTDTVRQYPLAKVYVKGGVSTITQSAITDMRGQAPTLWITSLVQQVDTTTLFTQFDTAFWDWFNNVKETLVTTTLMRKYTGVAYSTAINQTNFNVPISQYNSVLDILQVHLEGRILREGVDYVKNGTTSITLTTGLPVLNSLLYFEIFKSVDGSSAEDIASLFYNLEDNVAELTSIVNASRVTSKTGTDSIVVKYGLIDLENMGKGFKTVYIPSDISGLPIENKTWRGYVSLADESNGYVVIISQDGDVYTNTYLEGAWSTWKALYKQSAELLYTSTGNIMTSGGNVTPSKKLSECANGWVLHFSKLGALGTANFHYQVPKVKYDGLMWDGQEVMIDILYDFSTSGVASRTAKKLLIYDNMIRGFAGNGVSPSSNIALVAVTEY